MTNKDLVVVIPAHNEALFIGDLLRKIKRRVSNVVVVDDGSTDDTAGVARQAGAVVLTHPENRGKGAALKTGFTYAADHGFRAIMTVDGDGQHSPDDIPGLLGAFQEKQADIIIGCRPRHPKNMPLDRFVTNWFTSSLVSFLAGQRIKDSQSGFRIFDSRVVPFLSFSTSRFDTESEMLVEASRAGFKIAEVPITTIYGQEKSKQRPLRDTALFFRFFFRALFRKTGKEEGR
jgi:glycosyltransferase involved in cell wall biosynthesis